MKLNLKGPGVQLISKKTKYQCDECDSTYTNQSSLKTHKKSKHEGIRYPCEQCEYAATTSGNLRAH